MQAPVEIHYAGVVVARAEEMREVEGGDVFIVTKEPLPVGTLLGVSTPEAQFNGRVAHVVETVDGADNGMRVRRLGEGDPGANLWVPPPPAKPAPAPTRATPVAQDKAPESVAPALAAELPEVPATPTEPLAAPEAPPVLATSAAPAPEAAVPAPEKVALESHTAEPDQAPPTAEDAEDGAVASADAAAPERKAEQMPLIDDLPPARPTQGGNARRRTKRRK